MPNYGTPQAGFNQTSPGLNLTTLLPGDRLALFNAETPTAPQASVAFARGYAPQGQPPRITFTVAFAAQPTAVVQIQGANQDLDAQYQTLFSSAVNDQTSSYVDNGCFAFYRARLDSQTAGGALTVIAQL